MKIKRIKKLGTSKYELELDDNCKIVLYEETIIKYNLLFKKTLDADNLNEIVEFNDYAKAYDDALKYILKKMHCKKEIVTYLEKKEYNDFIICQVISRLENNKLINDELFVKAFINDRLYLSKDGPYKIKSDLENYNIDQELIDINIDSIDLEIVKNKLFKYIDKKKKGNTKYSEKMINNKLKQELSNLGYDLSLVDELLNQISYCNDDDLLLNEYEKVYKKYSKKYSGYELKEKIRNYLYSKGYSISKINELIRK